MSYTYLRTEPGLWTVGSGHPDQEDWLPHGDYNSTAEAAAWVAYLNGGGVHPDEALNAPYAQRTIQGKILAGDQLRAQLAGHALQAILVRVYDGDPTLGGGAPQVARHALAYADELLLQLDNTTIAQYDEE